MHTERKTHWHSSPERHHAQNEQQRRAQGQSNLVADGHALKNKKNIHPPASTAHTCEAVRETSFACQGGARPQRRTVTRIADLRRRATVNRFPHSLTVSKSILFTTPQIRVTRTRRFNLEWYLIRVWISLALWSHLNSRYQGLFLCHSTRRASRVRPLVPV